MNDMPSTVKNHLRILLHIFYFYIIADAFMPSCDDLLDKCQCHSSYTRYDNKGQEAQIPSKICLKLFREKSTWSDADRICKNEFSYLLSSYLRKSLNSFISKNDFHLNDSTIWIGIKRNPVRALENKYFRISNYPELYEEDDHNNYLGWAEGEPVQDCVAFDTASGNLITLPCETELAFVCQNTGFPVYPLSGTMACPPSWLFYYHSPMSREKCIRPVSFQSGTSSMDKSKACYNIGGAVADIADYMESYSYLSRLNITGFRITDGRPCEPKYLEAILGGSTSKIDCSHIVFICEQGTRMVFPSVRILPEFSNSPSSAEDSFLTCDVSFNDQNIIDQKNQLHYIWFRNGIPIGNRRSFLRFRDIEESVRWFTVPGQYRCGIMAEGIEDVCMSSQVMFLYSDVSIYAVTLEGNAKEMEYKDPSQKNFKTFKSFLDDFLLTKFADFFENLNMQNQAIFQNGWLEENRAYLKYYLYVKRSDGLNAEQLNENEFYEKLKEHIKDKDISFRKDEEQRIVLQLLISDTCFKENVSLSETSYHGLLLWRETKTKSVSEPMCLNDWRLVTRKCKPSLEEGAKWLPFNYSVCTKYQSTIKDSKIQCPKGFKLLDENLCYTIFKDNHTYEAAEKICRSRSSYVMDLEAINDRLLSELEPSSTYWISNRRPPEGFRDDDYSILNEDRRNPHCIITIPTGGIPSYSTSYCKSSKKFGLVCIHQPFLLLETYIFSRIYKKFGQQRSCYDLDKKSWKKTWMEANKSCQAFPIKSTLLQSIQNEDDYSIFKILMRRLTKLSTDSSWWTDLLKEMDSLKWSSMPEESVTLVDWDVNTDFSMKEAGVVLIPDPSNESSIRWTLKDLYSKEASICEIQNLEYTHPTSIHIADSEEEEDSNYDHDYYYYADLYCIPNGWFVSGSITWFKDGVALDSGNSSKHLHLSLESPFWKHSAEKISQFQGYYWCSVDGEIPYKQIVSDKILAKIPDMHTFVLYMVSELSNPTSCNDALALMIPFNEDLGLYLIEIFNNESMTIVKDVKCIDSALHIFHHVYISEDLGSEREIKQVLEKNFDSKYITVSELLNKHHIDQDNIYMSFRSTTSCPKEKSYLNGQELNWPETSIGEITVPEEICVTVDGDLLERECVGDFTVGGFWHPVEKNCLSNQPAVTLTLYELAKINITEENILDSTLNVESLTTTSDNLSSADIYFVASILKNAATVPVIEPEVLRSVVNTVDTVIDAMSISDNKNSLSNVSNKISSAMESLVLNTNTNDQVIKIAGNNIALTVLPHNFNDSSFYIGGALETWDSNMTILFNDSDINADQRLNQLETSEAAVLLPANVLTKNWNDNVTNTGIVIHKNYYKSKNEKVISPVIAVVNGDGPVYKLDPPIKMVFKVPEKSLSENHNWGCAFWDEKMNDNSGGWSYKGCFTILTDSMHVRCYCDHLTSFAVILEFKSGTPDTKTHQHLLSIITYVGCFLSIFGLGSIILTFIVFSKWRSELRHKVLFSLSLSLFFFLIIFMYGIERLGSLYGCMAVAVLLHYFMLATFSWMVVEAVLQYYGLVKVIGTYVPRFIQKASIFAWGLPLIIVVAVLSVDYELYRSNNSYCWVSNRVFKYAVAAPVLLMLATNFVIFGIISYTNTCGRSKKYLRSNQSEKQEMMARAKAVFCVSVLLGLSWIFGFLAAMEGAELMFKYLFASTTTLQGFLFFVFFILRQKKTRDLWLNFFKRPATTASHNTGGTDVDSKDLQPGQAYNKRYKVIYRAKM